MKALSSGGVCGGGADMGECKMERLNHNEMKAT